jgi:hypothetical protein
VLLILLGGALALAVGQLSLPTQVYTVAQVAQGLARHPAAWVGRTILIRGEVLQATEWIPKPRVWPTATLGASGVAVPWGWIGSTLVTSPTLPCITSNEPCASPLVEPLRPGPRVYVLLFDQMPDLSPPTTHRRTLPPLLTLLVQGPSPMLDALRRVPVIARWVPPLRYVDWGHAAVYRVTITPRPGRTCQNACPNGVMVDTVVH